MQPLLPLLLTMQAGTCRISHHIRLPYVSFASAVHYIHSGELFIPGQALCWPAFRLEETHPPVESADYQVVALTYRTLFGRHHARVFTNNLTSSEFLLLNDEGCATWLGRLRVTRDERPGVTLHCEASRVGEPGLLGRLLAPPSVTRERVEAAIVAGCRAVTEDAHLRAYRALVLRRCQDQADRL